MVVSPLQTLNRRILGVKEEKSSSRFSFRHSTPSLHKKDADPTFPLDRSGTNHSSCISVRDPNRPIHSLPGPKVPPRSASTLPRSRVPRRSRNRFGGSDANIKAGSTDETSSSDGCLNGNGRSSKMKLRRSTSERKLEKEKRNEERAAKARSVHFDGKNNGELNGVNRNDEFSLAPISIIGETRPKSDPALSAHDSDYDAQKKKVVVAQRPTSFIKNIKHKIRRRNKSRSKSDDEGFESATSPVSPPPTSSSFDFPRAPLAQQESFEEQEKYETEETKENKDTKEETEVVENVAEKAMTPEERKQMLRKYPYFRLVFSVDCGINLLAMDRGGTSDPYVKCIQGQEKLFQTRPIPKTVNPQWNEYFECFTDNPFKQLVLQVFDKDLVGSDDFMGSASLELPEIDLNKPHDFHLELNDGDNEDLIKKNKKRKPLGAIQLSLTVVPVTKEEMNEILRAEKVGGGAKNTKAKVWSAVVHVVLVQAQNLMAMDAGQSSDPYCRINLGKEKYRSKAVSCTVNPKWREAFDLYWYEENDSDLEITVWDKDVGSADDFMGRITVDLQSLRKESTHNLWRDVQDGKGRINILVTISATTKGDSPSNLANWEEDLDKNRSLWLEQYKLSNTLYNMKDVGHLLVKVFRAQGLAAADIGGKSDPFAVLELVNNRVQTNTEYKTLAPSWQKIYQFDVKDIHDVLELTVYDEDKDHKYEFLGKLKIPLLRIENGVKKWYALKDKKLRNPAKGDNPQILLEMFFVYNKVRASVRTFNPKQLKYEDKSDIKFKHSVFMRNVNRIKAATADMDPEIIIREIQSILNWESKPKSAGAFIGFLLGVYFFEPWMIPLGLIIPFVKNIVVLSITGGWNRINEDDVEDDDDDDVTGTEKENEKKSLKEKMQAMQDITLMVQNGLGLVAHVLESIGNVFNFSVPFLSWLALFVFCAVTVLLYFIPLRYLLMAWGTNKFTKKLLRPWAINNNELVDFISRVPDNEELKDFKDLPPPEELEKKKSPAKKKPPSDSDII